MFAGTEMGIYDREYYRGETRGSGWFSGVAPACKAIILTNVIVFVLQQSSAESAAITKVLAASSVEIFERGHLWQLLTSTFLHADFYHILWNMLFLWFVGREMEAMYGTRDFVALYLSAAVVSTLGWAVFDYFSDPQSAHGYMMGASGAVMAIVVLYTLYNPRQEILLFFLIPIEMWLLVVIYIAYDAWMLIQGGPGGKIAVASHLTGAAYGYLFKHFDLRWSRLPWNGARRPRLRIVMPEPREKPTPRPPSGPSWSANSPASPKPTATAVVPEEQLNARLDEVLAKIAREGRAGLTEDENRVLQEASRRARNRRSDRI
jgi:membrane associated rhomboid family serine protease